VGQKDKEFKDPVRRGAALESLRKARNAEAFGLSCLEAIEDSL